MVGGALTGLSGLTPTARRPKLTARRGLRVGKRGSSVHKTHNMNRQLVAGLERKVFGDKQLGRLCGQSGSGEKGWFV
jgi:hypothetical protein